MRGLSIVLWLVLVGCQSTVRGPQAPSAAQNGTAQGTPMPAVELRAEPVAVPTAPPAIAVVRGAPTNTDPEQARVPNDQLTRELRAVAPATAPAGMAAGSRDAPMRAAPLVPAPSAQRLPGGTTTIAAGSSNPALNTIPLGNSHAAGECRTDQDCGCGPHRQTGMCAVGPVASVDTERPCPDFCSGTSGSRRVVCDRGRCAFQP